MNILVTGGAGFIGSNFVRYLLNEEASSVNSLVNLDLLTYAGNLSNLKDLESNKSYTFVEGDIADQALISDLLQKHSIDVVVNFAAESHVDRSIDGPEPFFQTNVIGTLRLLEASKKYWQEQNSNLRVLHVSTDEVYGSLEEEDPAFTEENPYTPNSPYSASKAASDHIIRAYFHTFGMPVLTSNCSNNYGPYQFPEKLIPLMMLNALEGKKLPIYGNGLNVRDWLYVRDHCTALWAVAKSGRLGETYNIGGLNEQTNISIVDVICKILDEKCPRECGSSYLELKTFVKDRPGHDKRYAINCDKIQKELGWSPEETFETGIEKTVQWYLDNKEWCSEISEKKYSRERLGI